MQELISVIVPVYNADKTIVRCVESIVMQDYEEIEVILVNDDSSDKSHELCQQLQVEYSESVKYIKNICNLGVSASRNVGLKHAVGKYVVFVDSDDWIDTRYCRSLYSAVTDADSQIAICGFWYHDEISKMGSQPQICFHNGERHTLTKKDALELYDKWQLSMTWNKIYLREIIQTYQLEFDENLSIGEDLKFCISYIRHMECATISIVNEPLYHYIQANTNSLWFQSYHHLERGTMESVKIIYQMTEDTDDPAIKKRYQSAIHNIYEKYIVSLIAVRKEKAERVRLLKEVLSEKAYLDASKAMGLEAASTTSCRKLIRD